MLDPASVPVVDSSKARALAAAIRRHCHVSADGFVFDHPNTIANVAVAFLHDRRESAQARGRWINPTIKRLIEQHYPGMIPAVFIESMLRDRIRRDHGPEDGTP